MSQHFWLQIYYIKVSNALFILCQINSTRRSRRTEFSLNYYPLFLSAYALLGTCIALVLSPRLLFSSVSPCPPKYAEFLSCEALSSSSPPTRLVGTARYTAPSTSLFSSSAISSFMSRPTLDLHWALLPRSPQFPSLLLPVSSIALSARWYSFRRRCEN